MSHLTHPLERGSFYFFAVFFPLTPPSLPLVYPPTPSRKQAGKTRNFAGEKIETDLTKSIIYDRISIVNRSRKRAATPADQSKEAATRHQIRRQADYSTAAPKMKGVQNENS